MLRLIPEATTKRPYHLPPKIYQRVGLVARAISSLFDQYDRWPNDQEVYVWIHAADGTENETADLKHMTMREIKFCRRLLNERYDSLDSPLPTNGDGNSERSLREVTADTELGIDEIAQRQFDLNKIETEIDKLEPREKAIIRSRFMEEITLEEVSKNYGVSRERIRQIEKRTIEKIKCNLGIKPPKLKKA
jgi:RNA polymerase sigma factor (sigma-70 family)